MTMASQRSIQVTHMNNSAIIELTVQVNGYFEVSSNRHGIWYGADMDKSEKIRSLWNRLLLEEVVNPSFRLRGWEGVVVDVIAAAATGSWCS
ncbi:hypothetical protein LOK49_LG04G00513 [Camellia lanceoleosa]|uniref:Uncharacterized protein n=1 Tax=Camellia lanceoleosa TaxID=1840588 RepID=A0ACC0HUB9_9ERIC|nr:hypothetical protein LOK49_LG04G00513 [Camellia lanceoleosa]